MEKGISLIVAAGELSFGFVTQPQANESPQGWQGTSLVNRVCAQPMSVTQNPGYKM
jgi:hypothetical protein